MWLNRIKTVLLLAALSGIFLLIGHLFGGRAGLQIALIMAFAMNFIAYFFSEKIVLSLYKAQPLTTHDYTWIHEMVEELCQVMQMPKPKLWLIDTDMANAFATGRDPYHASVAVTAGILGLLDREELRGVLAHELAHIKNRDVLISTIAATIATAIGYLAHMAQYAAFWGSLDNEKKRSGANPIVMLAVAIIMPLAATLIQLAISRSREYLADETGAEISRTPLALASALEKLHHHVPHASMHKQDAHHATTASLFIVHPFTSDGVLSLFSTHPPMHKRIARLQQMCEKMF